MTRGAGRFVPPMAAQTISELPEGPEWVYEVKFDGYRALLMKAGDRIEIRSRNNKDLTRAYPAIVQAAKRLTAESLTLDGEACVLFGGEAVLDGDRVVARVRSGGYGHTLGVNVALAYLPVELARPGTDLAVESFGRRVPAVVRAGPLWDPRGERVRA